MKRTILLRVTALLLASLGFAACGGNERELSDNPNPYEPNPDPGKDNPGVMAEYGVPTAMYRVVGRIVDAQTQESIPGIKTSLVEDREPGYMPEGPYFSGNTGEFQSDIIAFPLSSVDFLLLLEDVDGELNGSYDDMSIEVSFRHVEFEGGEGGWYEGRTVKDMGIIEMTAERPVGDLED